MQAVNTSTSQLIQNPSNAQQISSSVSPNLNVSRDPSQIILTKAQVYKPFVSEKQLITTMAWQENQITATMRTFTDLIPKNFKIYKDYGDRMLTYGERLRTHFTSSPPECKDLSQLLLSLGQFFEIIGRLYSQNYYNLNLEMDEPLKEAVVVIRNHKDRNLNEKAMKMLPKAQQLHELAEKQKQDFEKTKRDTQDSLQKVKNAKQDPNIQYNVTEKQILDDKASKAVKELEEKKARYNNTVDQLEEKNKQFINALEVLSKEHQNLVDFSAGTVKKFLESLVTCELNHYEGLNIIAPEKGQVIKNFIIKSDQVSDIKVAEDMNLKIDLNIARQKLQDLPEPASNHTGVAPFCQYIIDTLDFYSKVTDKAGKFTSILVNFVIDLTSSEKALAKIYKEFSISDRKKKENIFGPFQGQALEFFRIIEAKEKCHLTFSRNLEAISAKSDQILKSYKTDEKTFMYSLSKIAKDAASTSEKMGKQTQAQEKQLSKISELLKGNFQGQNEKMTSFQNLMIEYQNITESLRENNTNFKAYLIQQIDNLSELVRNYKQSQSTMLKAISGVIQNIVNQEQILIQTHHKIQKDFIEFVQVLEQGNLINQFKLQIVNKQQSDLFDSFNQIDLDNDNRTEAPPVMTEIYADDDIVGSAPTKLNNSDSPHNNNPDGVGSSDQIFQFAPSELIEKRSPDFIPQRQRNMSMPQKFEGNNDQLLQEEGREFFEEDPKESKTFLNPQNMQSFQLGDQIPIDMRQSVSIKSEPFPKDSFSAQTYKHSQSVYQKPEQDQILSPLKKQFGKHITKKEDISLDEETKREIQELKESMAPNSTLTQLDDSAENLKKLSANCKFISEKFFGLNQGETCLESFSCAISMKILIQGRLYVSNKRLCFHSYFNDKTIFGKETKILIPLGNISRVEKKTNVMVFDNSISIFTKEEREIFITSFMFRDAAYELINLVLDKFNGRKRNRTQEQEETKQILPNQDEMIPSNDNLDQMQVNQIENMQVQEQEEQPEEEIPEVKPVYDNAEFKLTPEFKQAEAERLERMRKEFPTIEKFTFVGYEENIECSLKHIFNAFLNYGTKFSQYENLSIYEWLDKYPGTNIDNKIDKPSIQDAPSYFSNTEEPVPTPEEFKQWILASKFSQKMTHITEKPKMMQPKQNITNQFVDTVYVSPRIIIRRILFTLEQVPFSDSFNFEYKTTFEQEEARLPNGNFRTKIKTEFRVNIIKPIRFIQGTVVKETENSLRDSYCQGAYKEQLFKKLIETRDILKAQWNQEQANKSGTRSNKKQQKISQAQPAQEINVQQVKSVDAVVNDAIPSLSLNQAQAPQVFQVDNSKELMKIQEELQKNNQLTQKLIYLVLASVALNILMFAVYVLK